jgi:hypothetical protein
MSTSPSPSPSSSAAMLMDVDSDNDRVEEQERVIDEDDEFSRSEVAHRLFSIGQARGYVAQFFWNEHYDRGLSEQDRNELVQITEVHSNLPGLFHGILEALQSARLKDQTEVDKSLPLSVFHKNLVRPFADEVPASDARYRVELADGSDWVVIANRKEYIKLLYDGCPAAGICPYLIGIYGVVGGRASLGADPRFMKCTCAEEKECSWPLPVDSEAFLEKKYGKQQQEEEIKEAVEFEEDDLNTPVKRVGRPGRGRKPKKQKLEKFEDAAKDVSSSNSFLSLEEANQAIDQVWQDLFSTISQSSKKIDEAFKSKLAHNEIKLAQLLTRAEDAEESMIESKRQWHKELRVNEDLWVRYSSLKSQYDSLAKSLKSRTRR